MNEHNIKEILNDYKDGVLPIDDAMNKLNLSQDLDFAKIDYHREKRTGYPEVIYCEGKTIEQIEIIIKNMLSHGAFDIMGTRADKKVYEELKKTFDDLVYYDKARIISINKTNKELSKKTICIVTGGTADIPVAEEAAVTAELLGNRVDRIYDVGVAGIHRLFNDLDRIRSANIVIAVAGMEGALASVVAGLVSAPVIAVPTSVGYGANFGGLSALLCMLNSCANGVSVVNIDNGFGAGYNAAIMNNL